VSANKNASSLYKFFLLNSSSQVKTSVKENLFSEDSFSKLSLHPHMVDCLEKRFKLTKMTQVQEKAIPIIASGSDCFVKSQTGSGKTLSYAIPIIQKLQERVPQISRKDGIFALVLVPTRELAIQISEVFETLCKVTFGKLDF
jgi:ATP-dependent RNA helicase DDX31/DBP7